MILIKNEICEKSNGPTNPGQSQPDGRPQKGLFWPEMGLNLLAMRVREGNTSPEASLDLNSLAVRVRGVEIQAK